MLMVEVDQVRSVASIHSSTERDFDVELTVSRPEVLPTPVTVRADRSLPPGDERVINEGLPGLRMRTRRITRRSGHPDRVEDLGETTHQPVPRKVRRGTTP
jgi:uncharacterized protein YabE (DUF348 family)